MAREWRTHEVKSYELEKELNRLQALNYTIFSIHAVRGGFVDNFVIVSYYEPFNQKK